MRYSSGGVKTLRCQFKSAGSIGCMEDGGRSEAWSGSIAEKRARKNKSVFMFAEDSVCMLGSFMCDAIPQETECGLVNV
jgi:hypothetical protein